MHPNRRTFLSAASASIAVEALCGSSSEAQPPEAQEKKFKVTPAAMRESEEPKEHFTKPVRIHRIVRTPNSPSRTASSSVTFEPGARTWWHTHPLGQTLLITAGSGWVRCEGEPAQGVNAGDVVWIPANVNHWHGAKSNMTMTHIAIQEQDHPGHDTDWGKEVSIEEYPK